VITLEQLLTSPNGFGLTGATLCQRAMCRIFDGLPFDDLVEQAPALEGEPELRASLERAFGVAAGAELPSILTKPLEVYLLSGIRTAKSLTGAALAVRCALTVDLSNLRPWEEPCVSVLSLTLKKAKIIMRHLRGPLRTQPALRPLLAREPTESCVWIRRPDDGRVVRIEIAAGASAGGSLVGDWSAGCIFDEFPRMNGEDDGSAINFDDSRKAVLGRLLPGAQLAGLGSPWAPRGPAYDMVQEKWGKPSPQLVVLRPPSRAMNPVYWTDAQIAKLRSSPRGEWVYTTDFLGEFADPESAFFTMAELERVTRHATLKHKAWNLPRDPRLPYFAAMDPATRRNAWTLVIGALRFDDNGNTSIEMAYARQWVPTPSNPLKPREVLEEIRKDLAAYGVNEVHSDGYASDFIVDLAGTMGLTITQVKMTQAEIVKMFDALRMRVLGATFELHPDPYVKGDLLAVRKVVTNQSQRIALPITADGRHCDYAPAVALLNHVATNGGGGLWMHAMGRLGREGGSLLGS
jgi:hypothetical protein